MNSTQRKLLAVAAAAALALAGFGLYRLGVAQGQHGPAQATATMAAAPAAAVSDPSTWTAAQGEEATRRHLREGIRAGSVDPATGRKVLYYQDPMAPGTRFEAPGKSPFMDMMLVPVYAGSGGADAGSVSVSPRMQQSLGVRTAVVTEGRLAPQVVASGNIGWNERDQVVVQARASAFVERLHVRANLDPVRQGQPLAELYVPDWVAAQEEFLAVRRMQGAELGALREAARARMRQAGMSLQQIQQVESTGRVQARITLTAPISGVVTEVAAREGMAVMPGTTMFRINGLATVWAQAEVPESQAAQVRPGVRVRATTPAVPGEVFEGRVQALLPEVASGTRTIKARMELANKGGRLVPGMFVQMQFSDADPRPSLLVPSEAVIHTGRRTVVMLAEDGGGFRSVAVETGTESGGQVEIRRGLQAGQKVVVSSQFLIDSEASLRGLEARLNAPAAAAPSAHRTSAKVEEIDQDAITLSHPEIPALKWPAMTMEFKLAQGLKLPPGLAAGDAVEVEFRVPAPGEAEITALTRNAAPSKGKP
ncbi:MAG TPA: efflux RND transporter periplasmic adaptor subunit [Ramlibacter sp.]